MMVSTMLTPSELILNPDGSVYHLNLLPQDIADTIILVGDPNRVAEVSRHFDRIDVKKSKREFVTHTGMMGKKRLSVVGTGIGAGNIDITMNEIDALFNIDLETRTIKKTHQSLRFIRLGTSGALQPDIAVDSLVISRYAVGMDGLVRYYDWQETADEKALRLIAQEAFATLPVVHSLYAAAGSEVLTKLFSSLGKAGITLTSPGFYGAQDRRLRIPVSQPDFLSFARQVHFKDCVVTNLEMETAAIYGLARLLGHEACSISAIVANREQQVFSEQPQKTIDAMIEQALGVLSGG